MAASNGVTIIKRKKITAGDGHHGGAWKVAYADFVTAMMAFFLLMWLLNATTEDQRKGLAEYFDPKIPISKVSGGGASVFGGDSIFSEDAMAQNGAGASALAATESRQARGETGVDPAAGRTSDGVAPELTDLDNLFRGMSGESDAADPLLEHIRTRVTDEGLVIELFDAPRRPLFERGSARPTRRMQDLLRMIGETAALVTNRIAVAGHADPAGSGGAGDSKWELSADRANGARRALTSAGVEATRMERVVGKADREAARPDEPAAPGARRVTITLLRSDL
jgi:chemotaxis protein MotB